MIDIMGKRKILYVVSGLMFIFGVLAILKFGFKLGIDFTGGSLVELQFATSTPSVQEVQKALEPMKLGTIVVQPTENNGLILRLPFLNEDSHQEVLEKMRGLIKMNSEQVKNDAIVPVVIERKFETIGSTVSNQLKERTSQASVLIIIVIVGFIAYAFKKVSRPVASWKYGVAAVLAMIHDVTIVAGIFAILGYYKGIEIDIPFIVAMLTVFGYSVNDTIVVFDRIRENLIKRTGKTFVETVNLAINETLARSINTSVTTLIVLISVYLFGGESIKYFSLALIVGIFLGTYSSIFVASSLLVSWEEWQRKAKA